MITINDEDLLSKHLSTGEPGFWLAEVAKPEYKAWSGAYRDELQDINRELYALQVQMQTLVSRKHWIQGLYLVAADKAEIRSRGGLGVYLHDKTSPSGVVRIAGAQDDEAHRAEVRAAGRTVYASAASL